METQRNDRPVIAITMGDAAGVGPEIIVKALAHAELYGRCRPLVVGDARRLEAAAELCGLNLAVRRVKGVAEARFEAGTVDCIDLGLIPDDLPFGKLSAVAGDAAYQYIRRAVELARAGQVGAICTAPLNKEALHAGGLLQVVVHDEGARPRPDSRRAQPARIGCALSVMPASPSTARSPPPRNYALSKNRVHAPRSRFGPGLILCRQLWRRRQGDGLA